MFRKASFTRVTYPRRLREICFGEAATDRQSFRPLRRE